MRDRLFKIFLRLFRFNTSKQDKIKKGTIIVLIDGLSFDALQYAISKKKCPTIKKLLKKGYMLQPYYCGLPAATTATEALLLYGNKANIPGFTWLDRDLGEFVRGNRSYELSKFEDIYPKKRSLLHGGSSIMSVYNGGATELSLSGRNLTFSRSTAMIKAAHYLLMTILYPIQLLRAFILTIKMLFLYTRSDGRTAKETMSTVFLGQFSCFLTEVEIMRNTQKIFVDFLLYDEFAHEHGPTHSTPLSTLRLIDRYINRIVKTAENSGNMYDIVILSDHGQTQSTPYDLHTLRSVSEIKMALNDEARTIIKTYGDFIPNEKKRELYLVPAGSTLQLYFSESIKKPFDSDDLKLLYPHLLSNLLKCEGFGWVLVRNKDGSRTLYGKQGTIDFKIDETHSIHGNPFEGLPKEDIQKTIQSFQEYSSFNNNGDLLLFGSVAGGSVTSFEMHKGTHGGFYGPMVHPFILSPLKLEKDISMEKIFTKIEYNMK